MSHWLNEKQLRETAPAESAAMRSPIPTQVVSNGEYVPSPQSTQQRQVERVIGELADTHGRRLGLDRRQFLKTTCGMAAAFVAMNRVYGNLFSVGVAEAAEPAAAAERLAALSGQPVVDVQLHFLREDFNWDGILVLGEWAKKWNPVLEREGVSLRRYKLENFVKEVFLDSETRIGLISGAPSDDPSHGVIGSAELARARDTLNAVAGSRRVLSHSILRPGQPGWIEEIDRALAEWNPDSWKGYTVGDPLAPSEWPWRMDDEKLTYRGYEKIAKSNRRIVCVHKGLLPADYETSTKHWRYAMVDDVGKAAKDWPQLTFVIYHSGLKPFLTPPDESLAQFEKTGRMDWVSDLAEVPAKYGVTNVYAELGTSFATAAVTHPRHSAALLGTLIRGMGPDHVLWGTDSVWYGSPQWQIEAFRRIEIPEDMRKKRGFAALGAADGPVKSAILAGNAAKLYGIDLANLADTSRNDSLAVAKREYESAGSDRSNAAYGFIRRASQET
ncbi:MAG TPA: amidohydrolase family protein [Myxococcota bacterium]|nr:amidohydrolase family protein [Myxococcota bacterium]